MNRQSSLFPWGFFLLFIPCYYSYYFTALIQEEEESSQPATVNTKNERKLPKSSAGSLIYSTGLSFFCKQQIKATI